MRRCNTCHSVRGRASSNVHFVNGQRVKRDSDQRMVAQEQRVDSDRCSWLISVGNENVELVTAKVCWLTDHVVQSKSV